MKILHLIRSVNPVGGGPIEGVKQLGLVNRITGHQIEVVSLDAPDAEFLTTFPLPLHPLGPSWLKYGYSNRLLPWLRENVAKYDIVIVNGLWQYHSFGGWLTLPLESVSHNSM